MISNQDILKQLADAVETDDASGYKSVQELLRVIAGCVRIDEETGEAYLAVKEVEE